MTGGGAPLAEIVRLLDGAGLAYMVVGSFASTYHGPPRTTQDIDVVVELDDSSLPRLLALIDRERYYIPEASARDAVRQRGQFNIIDLDTGWKVDVILRRDRAFSREEFARRQRVVLDGVELFLSSPEDTVLSKLEWSRSGGSDRQVTDAASVLAVGGERMDDAYLDRWAEELGVTDLLDRARAEARP